MKKFVYVTFLLTILGLSINQIAKNFSFLETKAYGDVVSLDHRTPVASDAWVIVHAGQEYQVNWTDFKAFASTGGDHSGINWTAFGI